MKRSSVANGMFCYKTAIATEIVGASNEIARNNNNNNEAKADEEEEEE